MAVFLSLDFWLNLLTPLLRVLLGLSVGILIANLLEALHWTSFLGRLGRPIALRAHFGTHVQAAFTMAFISPQAANGLLSEAYLAEELTSRELLLATLFLAFPSTLVHLPTLFFLLFPVLGSASLIYVGIALLAAFFRTAFVFLLARILLPPRSEAMDVGHSRKPSVADALQTALRRLRRRLPSLLFFTVPVYLLVSCAQVAGIFAYLERWLSESGFWAAYISPQAAGIVVLHIVAELGSALGASASLLATGSMTEADVVCALLIGSILATPIRALRHQLPSYAGFFTPRVGLRLVVVTQLFRAFFLLLFTICFFCLRTSA